MTKVYTKDNSNSEVSAYSWSYTPSGSLLSHTDSVNNRKYLYDYDSTGRLIRSEISNKQTGANLGYIEQGYDKRNNAERLITSFGGRTIEQKYKYTSFVKKDSDGEEILNNSAEYAQDNLPTMYEIYSSRYAVYEYDSINRLTQRMFTLDAPLYYNYIYKSSGRNGENGTKYRTTQLSKEFIGDDVYGYTYDSVGNIVSVSKGNRTYAGSSDKETGEFSAYRSYEYDDLGQLTRENNKTTDKATNKTKVWNYDSIGNIESVSTYNYTTGDVGERQTGIDYQYTSSTGWNKLLTKLVFKEYEYNSDGSFYISSQTEKSITYDEIGNPTNYMGATLTWNGRQLTTYTKQGLGTITYTYDSNGLRTTKTAGGVTTEYYYAGDKLIYEKRSDGTELYYFYDSYGHLSGIRNGNTSYYTATNMSGDVVAIYNGGGTCIAKYEYDAWGNVLSVKDANDNPITSQTHIAKINPIRYRGYYYDTETELYYLQSRYYNPEIGRFLNGDGYLTTGQGVLSYNMFAYCNNNPVMYSDSSGNLPEWAKKALNFIVGKVISIMTKSKNPKIKLCGDTLNAAKKGFEKGQKIMSIENPLTAPTAIKEQYVNDIDNVGKNGATVTKTPDPIIFPDVNEYNVRCQDMWDDLSTSPVYSDLSGGYFDKTEAQNTIICWDYETCFDLCEQTILTTFTETMVDIMEVLYG